MLEQILNQKSLFIFDKDASLRYLFCNENLAEAAGLDSPHQIKNKTDKDLFWRAQTDCFTRGDRRILKGRSFKTHVHPAVTQTTCVLNGNIHIKMKALGGDVGGGLR